MKQELIALYEQLYGEAPQQVDALSGSASNRQYFRLTGSDGNTVIGVVGDNYKENHAFVLLARTMAEKRLPVPQLLAVSGDEMCYLQEDLGTTSLYDRIAACQKAGAWDDTTVQLLHQVMRDLPRIQFETGSGFDYSQCYREQHFNASVVRWDLNYFKYCFLKPSGLVFDELALEADYDRLVEALLAEPVRAFMYRDFQSRNVMVASHASHPTPCYIDFQGGYEGPFYYDVASFLWQARAAYPEALRQELLREYHAALQPYHTVAWQEFVERLELFVFFRLIQVLGAYGFRGLFERKAAFISPITQALKMVAEVAANEAIASRYPYLCQLLQQLQQMERFQPQPTTGKLTVRISSFSYKKGIPEDNSGNGGGFVFDCRAPHNPGRYKEFKKLTGLDQPVIDFLEGRLDNPEYKPIGTELSMPQYLEHVYALVDPAVATYLQRGFTSLMVNFGCTGGQHRSVYGAQHLAEHLKALHPDLHIILTHREQGICQEL